MGPRFVDLQTFKFLLSLSNAVLEMEQAKAMLLRARLTGS